MIKFVSLVDLEPDASAGCVEANGALASDFREISALKTAFSLITKQ
jgi:hypothetical protein